MLEPITREVVFVPAAAPTAVCHASTLAAIPGGVACAWFGGPFEGARETGIWSSLRGEGGWSAPSLAADVEPMPHWNPVLHCAGETLHLYFKVGIYPKRWRTYATRAQRGGPWAPARELVPGDEGGRGPVKNKLLVLSTGEWLAPASLERDAGWDCFVDRSTDDGQTWEASSLVPLDRATFSGAGIIQPALWESSPGCVHLLARSSAGRIYRADSTDGGRTWSQARATAIPHNNSGLDVVRLACGALFLACNPVEGRARTPLVLYASAGAGEEWEPACVLEDGAGEFSYPALNTIPGGFALSYTQRRETIAYASFAWPA